MKDKTLVWTGLLNEPAFNSLPEAVQNIAFRIIYMTDDYGITIAEADFIKKEAAYYNPRIKLKTIEEAITLIEKAGIFRTYTVEGRRYLILSKTVNRLMRKPEQPLPPWLDCVKKEDSRRDYELVQRDLTVNDRQCPTMTVNDRQCTSNITEPNKTEGFCSGEQNRAGTGARGGVDAPPPPGPTPEEEEAAWKQWNEVE